MLRIRVTTVLHTVTSDGFQISSPSPTHQPHLRLLIQLMVGFRSVAIETRRHTHTHTHTHIRRDKQALTKALSAQFSSVGQSNKTKDV